MWKNFFKAETKAIFPNGKERDTALLNNTSLRFGDETKLGESSESPEGDVIHSGQHSQAIGERMIPNPGWGWQCSWISAYPEAFLGLQSPKCSLYPSSPGFQEPWVHSSIAHPGAASPILAGTVPAPDPAPTAGPSSRRSWVPWRGSGWFFCSLGQGFPAGRSPRGVAEPRDGDRS